VLAGTLGARENSVRHARFAVNEPGFGTPRWGFRVIDPLISQSKNTHGVTAENKFRQFEIKARHPSQKWAIPLPVDACVFLTEGVRNSLEPCPLLRGAGHGGKITIDP
jgi:hypothetical protein